jgi:hypothetical protein
MEENERPEDLAAVEITPLTDDELDEASGGLEQCITGATGICGTGGVTGATGICRSEDQPQDA